MNTFELEQFICESALENPLVELEMPSDTEDQLEKRLKRLEWLDSLDDKRAYRYVSRADRDEHFEPLYENKLSESLPELLLAQLSAFRAPEELKKRVQYLIGNLDDNGYIAIPYDQLLKGFAMDEPQLVQAIEVLQRMDPPGVGAFDLRECLLIQARRNPDSSQTLIRLIESHLDTLAKNQLSKLARKLNVSIDEVIAARNELLKLNPKPGNGCSSYNAIQYIQPDLIIIRFEDSFRIIYDDYNQPKIEISGYYRKLAEKTDSEAAKYINERLNKAEWLISCIEQRRNTILRCAESILRRQMRFFEEGPGNLVPMTLADIAEDIDMHISTVSRAISGKYMQCQWGVFRFSELFSRGVGQTGNDSKVHSQDMMLLQIKRIIDEEDSSKPKSDQAIAAQLHENGINIARRTVAKYREQMGIPSASGRKKY